MRTFSASAALLGLMAVAQVPSAFAKPYPVHMEEFRDLHNATQLDKRACSGTTCGYYGQLCCPSGSQCVTDANNEAQCSGAQAVPGGWAYYTTTYVVNGGPMTYTSVYSSYTAAQTATCASPKSPCGSTCCDSGFWCNASQTCQRLGGGTSGGILPTVSVTYTGRPTTTVPFQTPISTGVNGAPVAVGSESGGLSGGAIAGIVIGVILGILLLLLLCLFCCARALFDTILAIFGFGKKKKHTHEETYVEEHHHSSGGAAGGWYGRRPARPSRPGSEKKSGFGKGMGMAAALGGLALALGLKRKHDQKHDDKSTTVSGSSYYYSDYTSSSSASSDDRRTRNTRHSSRR